MKFERIEFNEREENGVKYFGAEYAIGDNYTLERFWNSRDGLDYVRMYVRINGGFDNENYMPKIYYNDDWFGEKKPHFTIQTTSYGDMKPEEIRKVIAGYQEAIEVVSILEAVIETL